MKEIAKAIREVVANVRSESPSYATMHAGKILAVFEQLADKIDQDLCRIQPVSDVVGSIQGGGGITIAIRCICNTYAIEMLMDPYGPRTLSRVDLNELAAMVEKAREHEAKNHG